MILDQIQNRAGPDLAHLGQITMKESRAGPVLVQMRKPNCAGIGPLCQENLRRVWARSGPNDFCYLVRTQPINSQFRVGFSLYYSRTKLIRNYFASYLLGMMLGSASLLYIFNDYSIAKLHHFSCRMPHAVANNIKKYVDLLLLKMFNVTDNAYKL